MPYKRKHKSYALDKAVSQLPLLQSIKKPKKVIPEPGYKSNIADDGTIVLEGPFVSVHLPPKRPL